MDRRRKEYVEELRREREVKAAFKAIDDWSAQRGRARKKERSKWQKESYRRLREAGCTQNEIVASLGIEKATAAEWERQGNWS
jgi:hypothetical protein